MDDSKIFEADLDIKKLLTVYDSSEIYKQFLGKIRYLIEKLIFRYWEKQIGESRDYNYPNSLKSKSAAVKPGSSVNYRNIKFFFERINIFQHDLADNESAKVAINSYYTQLIEIRDNVKHDLGLSVLSYLESFYPEKDKTLERYYSFIAKQIENIKRFGSLPNTEERFYYVIKDKTFYINGKHYFETTISQVLSNSKFDKFIVYSSRRLSSNYGLILNFYDLTIDMDGQKVPIKILGNSRVGIRACELNRLAKLSNTYKGSVYGTAEYNSLLNHLNSTKNRLIDLIYYNDEDFEKIKDFGGNHSNSSHKIYDTLKVIRNIILQDKVGKNIFKFLLTFVRRDWINDQISFFEEPNALFDNLPIKSKSFPFEEMPYAFSICGHDIPRHYIYEAIDPHDRKHEILASLLQINVNQNGILYYPIEELKKQFPDYLQLANKFNSLLTYQRHKDTYSIEFADDYAFLKGYESSSLSVIKSLIAMSKLSLNGYQQFVSSILVQQGIDNADVEKDNLLKNCFSNSRVFILSGAAGTGKTFFISKMCGILHQMNPLILARTNPAVKNLRGRPNIKKSRAMTIDRYLYNFDKGNFYDTNLLIIDECSTVSNEDIYNVLKTINLNNTLVLLAGDEHQIESIDFGNWFSLALKILPDFSKGVLKTNYRSTLHNQDEENMLKKLWDNALINNDKSRIVEIITSNYYKPISSFDFNKDNKDEIILCLNYDGFYGINNINRVMQSRNLNEKTLNIGDWRYSVGDPVIFETNKRFSQYIYNDTKGVLLDIEQDENRYIFTLEIDQQYNPIWDLSKPSCFLSVKKSSENKSIISFYVNKKVDYEADESDLIDRVIPFRVTYCISIHKAQGLEFENVKIVITDNVQEMISPNIFYTAITRTTHFLEIYSSPDSISSICGRMCTEFKDDHDYKEFVHRHHSELYD